MLDQATVGRLALQGHTIHPERSSYTHAIFWERVKDLPKDSKVTEKGHPIPAPHLGRDLMVGDILPERLALGVDENSEILDGPNFSQQYRLYISEFGGMGQVADEPVPNVKTFLMVWPDPTQNPENGKTPLVEIGFDPNSGGDAKETGEWHPDGIRMSDWLRDNPQVAQSDSNEARTKELVTLLDSGVIDAETLADRLLSIHGNEEARGAEAASEADAGEPEMVTAESSGRTRERTPCGKLVTQGYLNQHVSRCKGSACREARGEVD